MKFLKRNGIFIPSYVKYDIEKQEQREREIKKDNNEYKQALKIKINMILYLFETCLKIVLTILILQFILEVINKICLIL